MSPNKVDLEFEKLRKALKGKPVLITIPTMYLGEIDKFIESKNISRSTFLWKAAIEQVRRAKGCNHPRMRNGDCPEVKCDNCRWKKGNNKRR